MADTPSPHDAPEETTLERIVSQAPAGFLEACLRLIDRSELSEKELQDLQNLAEKVNMAGDA